jgi:hypothetical protein
LWVDGWGFGGEYARNPGSGFANRNSAGLVLRERAAVSLPWVAEAVSRMKHKPARKLQSLKKRLSLAEEATAKA